MANPTRSRPSRKAANDRPKKPYPDFPLSPHPSGKWQKKILGRIHYFGHWATRANGKLVRVPGDGWQEALEEYKAVADDLHAGRTPRPKSDCLSVADLCNRFLTAKLRKRTAGEIGSRMFEEYKEITDLIVAAFGSGRRVDDLAASDFEELRAAMAERWGPVRLGNAITRVKSVFKYGVDNALIDRPPRYGSEFKKPDKKVLRLERAKKGEMMFEAEQLRQLLGLLPWRPAADAQMAAMILLGINAGYGNHDVATLPLSALDLDAGWLSFPRPKTGIPRRCPLWPETVAAIREALAARPVPKDKADADIVFLIPAGRRWVRLTDKSRTDSLSMYFGELMKRLGIHRNGLNFYALRHTFRTIADAARDPVAIDLIMGHSDPSMGGHYRERVEDSRLVAVTDHVRQWLFGPSPNGNRNGSSSPWPESGTNADSCQTDEARSRPDNSRLTLKTGPGPSSHTRPSFRIIVG